MFATVRRYARLPPSTVDGLGSRADDLRLLLLGIPGCSCAHLIRTREGVVLVTLGDDEPSLVEAGRRFAAWTGAHVPGFPPPVPPDVWAGEVLLDWRATPERAVAGGETRDPR